jgi:hypothetical protein
MAYNNFTLTEIRRQFGLTLYERDNLFGHVAPISVSPWLQEALREFAPLALAMSTEKARSEMIIAPILLEARRQSADTVSLFSGMEFTVDAERGLSGFCDYLFSRSPLHFAIEAPVIAVVEAKNENLKGGLGQCVAEMIAAQIFNIQQEKPLESIYGVVTTGSAWKFLKLVGTDVDIDLTEHYLDDVEQIVGILGDMLAH